MSKKNLEKAKWVFDVLCALYPDLFSKSQAVPLKIGIFDDLLRMYPDLPRQPLKTAIRRHTNNVTYWVSCSKPRATRYGINGSCGEVTDEQAAHARKMLGRE